MITLKKLLERVKDGKLDPLSKMGKRNLLVERLVTTIK